MIPLSHTNNMVFSFTSSTKPVTVNQLYGNANGGKKYLRPIGKLFKVMLGRELLGKIPTKPFACNFINLTISSTCKGDIDNYAKALIDTFVLYGIIEDDRNIDGLVITRSPLPKTVFFKCEFYQLNEEKLLSLTRSPLH